MLTMWHYLHLPTATASSQAAIDWYLLLAGLKAANVQQWFAAVDWRSAAVGRFRDRQTDRRTLYCYIDPAPHTTVYEGSAKKINVQLHSINHTQTDWLMAKLTVRWTYTASCGYTSVNATLWDGFARHTCMCIHIIMTCYNTKSFHSFSYIIVQMCYSNTGYRLLTNRNCISRWIYQWRWQSYI